MRLLPSPLLLFLLCASLSPVSGEEKTAQAKPIVMQSLGFQLVIPESRDKLMAFSLEQGTWSQAEIADENRSAALQKLAPTVSSSMACCLVGSDLYAYSAETGHWRRLRVSADFKVDYTVGNDIVMASLTNDEGASLYFLFSQKSEAWSGVDLATGKLLTTTGENNKKPGKKLE